MKKVIMVILAVTLFSTGFVFAASINGTFQGFPIINVNLNGQPIKSDVPAVSLSSRTMLPVRAIAEATNSVVVWDQSTMTANIIKPEINMVLCGEVGIESDQSWTVKSFGLGFDSIGKDKYINVAVSIGPMNRQLYTYRIIMRDPSGNVLKSSDTQDYAIDQKGILTNLVIEGLTYQVPGIYKVQFQIKFSGEFQTVGETSLIVE